MADVVVTFRNAGRPMTQEELVFAFSAGISSRFRSMLADLPKEERDCVVRALAERLERQVNECGARQFRDVAPALLSLGVPDQEECDQLDAFLKDLVEIRRLKELSLADRAWNWFIGRPSTAVKHAAGVIWLKLYRRLSGREYEPEPPWNAGAIRG